MAAKSTTTKSTPAAPEPASGEVIDLEKSDASPASEEPSNRFGFGDFFDFVPSLFSERWPEALAPKSHTEPMKVEELVRDDAYVVRAELPGVDPEAGIDVSVHNGRLTIKAEREHRAESETADEYRSEFRYGSIRRSMALPPGADADDIEATYRDGILEVRVPVTDDDEAGRTTVQVTRAD